MARSTLSSRTLTLVVLLGLALWSIASFCWFRPEHAVLDIQGWRQADTQTIALNLTKPGASIFYPAVAWGGDGPGYAETELQIYTGIVAQLMKAFGQGEWAGQLVSSLAIFATGVVVVFDLRRRHGELAAICGLLALLGVRSVGHLSTSIQPDALSLFAYAASWALFLRYRDYEKTTDLLAYTVVFAFAMLVKPTAGQLGVSCALLLLMSAPRLLKKPGVWLAWTAVLALVGVYLWHAHQVWLHYGNSFGLFKGGNEKVPTLGELVAPQSLFYGAKLTLLWGVGFAGALAFAVLLVLKRRLTPELWALLAGNALMTLAFIRITSTMAGSHYVVPSALLAAEAVAVVVPSVVEWARARPPLLGRAVALGGALAVAVPVLVTLHFRTIMASMDLEVPVVYRTGLALKQLVHPGDLVLVRAKVYDPRIFYLANVRGWLVNRDKPEVGDVPRWVEHGARFLIDAFPASEHTPLEDWLEAHGRRVGPANVGAIWDLRAHPATKRAGLHQPTHSG